MKSMCVASAGMVMGSALLLMAGCDGERGAQPAAPAMSAEVAPSAMPVSPGAQSVGEVVLEFSAQDEDVRTSEVGEKVGGIVRAKGEGGALVFGPYVSLKAGRYTLQVEGSSAGPFRIDVAQRGGTVQVAAKEFASATGRAPGKGSLASLDFETTSDADGVEFRVVVPDNADTTVASYKVLTR